MLFFPDKKASDKAAEASARKNLQFLNGTAGFVLA